MQGKISKLIVENVHLRGNVKELQREKEEIEGKVEVYRRLKWLKMQLEVRNERILEMKKEVLRGFAGKRSHGVSRSEASTPKNVLVEEIKSTLERDLSPKSSAVQRKIEAVRQHVAKPLRSLSFIPLVSPTSPHLYPQLLQSRYKTPLTVIREHTVSSPNPRS